MDPAEIARKAHDAGCTCGALQGSARARHKESCASQKTIRELAKDDQNLCKQAKRKLAELYRKNRGGEHEPRAPESEPPCSREREESRDETASETTSVTLPEPSEPSEPSEKGAGEAPSEASEPAGEEEEICERCQILEEALALAEARMRTAMRVIGTRDETIDELADENDRLRTHREEEGEESPAQSASLLLNLPGSGPLRAAEPEAGLTRVTAPPRAELLERIKLLEEALERQKEYTQAEREIAESLAVKLEEQENENAELRRRESEAKAQTRRTEEGSTMGEMIKRESIRLLLPSAIMGGAAMLRVALSTQLHASPKPSDGTHGPSADAYRAS